MARTRQHDVVVIGAGLAGLTAGLAAAETGLDVIILEQSDQIGGATGWSYGALWVADSAQAKAAGIVDDPEAALNYLGFLGGGENDPDRSRAIVDHAARILARIEAAGARFELIGGVGDLLFGTAPGAIGEGRTHEPTAFSGQTLGTWRQRLRTPPGDNWWRVTRSVIVNLPGPAAIDTAVAEATQTDQLAQGPALIASLLLAVLDRNVPVITGARVAALVNSDGRVTGVRLDDGQEIAAGAVVLATGNYAADRELVAALDKLPGYQPYFPDTANGDGLVMASRVGAAIRHTRNNVMIMLGLADPDGEALQAGAPSTRELPRAHTIVVNAAGHRFGNEASFQDLSRDIRAMEWGTRNWRNLPCWMVADHTYVARWGIGGRGAGCVPDFVVQAPDIATLAHRAGIDAAGLAATVVRVNGFAATGIDTDFGRKPGWALVPGAGSGPNPSLGAIAQPPFYAARLAPTMGVVGSGIKADAKGRVLDWRGAVIDGLYCAGDAALHDEFGVGYQAGVTYASAMTFAWLAVEDIVASGNRA